jgi:hypothetical protein
MRVRFEASLVAFETSGNGKRKRPVRRRANKDEVRSGTDLTQVSNAIVDEVQDFCL